MTTDLSADYIRAAELNRRIITAAQLAQQSLYEMCMGFKEMRDSGLYKELGYGTFEDYCENETGFKRRQVYNYISIAEKLPEDFVQSIAQIGMTKVLLLTTLSEEERTQITSETDLESATVKELEQQIKQLRAEKDKAVADKSAAEAEGALKADTIAALEANVNELTNRPVEVAVEKQEVIPEGYVSPEEHRVAIEEAEKRSKALSDEIMRLKSSQNAEKAGKLAAQIAELEQQLKNQRSETTKAYGKASKAAYDSETKGKALEEAQKKNAELEAELKKLKQESAAVEPVTVTDTAPTFRAYMESAYTALNKLVEFINGCDENAAEYAERTIKLIDSVKKSLR